MNSSTSISDEPGWRPFVLTLLLGVVLIVASVLALELLVDPYDLGLLDGRVKGVAEFGARLVNASRSRDPAFDGAILGNSHIQLVDPGALSQESGIPFVSLAVIGTGPREQLTLLDAFLRHRTHPARALVLGLDNRWCTDDPALPVLNPFPFWIYDQRPWSIIGGLLRYSTVEHTMRTLAMRAGHGTRARPDGYWKAGRDLERPDDGAGFNPSSGIDPTPYNETGSFPALDQLAERLDRLPANTAVVLVRPPVYVAALEPAGSALARSDADCLVGMRRIADRRAGSVLLDLRTDWPEARDTALWLDQTHFREPLARLIETEVGVLLKQEMLRGRLYGHETCRRHRPAVKSLAITTP